MFEGISIEKISFYLPDKIEYNEQLDIQNPSWNVHEVAKKTGILQRHLTQENQTAVDIAYEAGKKLMKDYKLSNESIEALILVTQSPDYALPSSSCILQERLKLNNNILAFDISLGCSGFVNALSIVLSLISSKTISNCILICAETYSKYINPCDRTNKLIFSDASSACFIERNKKSETKIHPFTFGCDGSGANNLIVENSGVRKSLKNDSKKELYMNGPAILLFTLTAVPKLVLDTLKKLNLKISEIDLFIFHQASALVLNQLAKKLNISEKKFFSNLSLRGNTVSSSIPIALKDALDKKLIKRKSKVLIAGFGVGYSLGATVIEW